MMDGYSNDVAMMDGDARDNMDIKITEVRKWCITYISTKR